MAPTVLAAGARGNLSNMALPELEAKATAKIYHGWLIGKRLRGVEIAEASLDRHVSSRSASGTRPG